MFKKNLYSYLFAAQLIFLCIVVAFVAHGRLQDQPTVPTVAPDTPQALANELSNLLRRKVSVEAIVIEWSGRCQAKKVGLVMSRLTKPKEVDNAIKVFGEVMLSRCQQVPASYSIEALILAPPSNLLVKIGLVGGVIGGWLIVIAKYFDYRLSGLGEDLKKYKNTLARLEATYARKSWRTLIYHAIQATDSFLSEHFGKKIWGWRSLVRCGLLSLTINLYLCYVPLLADQSPYHRGMFFDRLSTAVYPAWFAAINIPLDVLSMLAIMQLCRHLNHPALRSRSQMMPGIYTVLGVVLIGWFFAGLSTAAGAALSTFAFVDPSNLKNWTQIVGPLIASWLKGAMLSPFVANAEMGGTNMGYAALGALVGWSVLLAMLLFFTASRYFPMRMHKEFGIFLKNFVRDDKEYYTTYGRLGGWLIIAISSVLCFFGSR